jgi:ubiquinone/menaquinone biosynthesis C-methylase UbiE
LLGKKDYLAPIGGNPQRVLDIGCGTGIWCIDFADKFPSASVSGFECVQGASPLIVDAGHWN